MTGSLIGTQAELTELAALAARGGVRVTTSRYPLRAFRDALADLQAGRIQGRAILVP